MKTAFDIDEVLTASLKQEAARQGRTVSELQSPGHALGIIATLE